MRPGSLENQLLLRWIGQGMPPAADDLPHVERIAVVPHERVLDRHARQQLAVVAYSSDGTVKDVTHFAHFETSTPEMAEVTPAGLMTTRGPAGDVAVMVRYQGYVDVFRGMVPLAANLATTPPPRNFIDEIVFAKLKTLGMPPSARLRRCDVRPPGGIGHRRALALGRRSAGVFGRSRLGQARQVDRQAVGFQRLRRFFCHQMERHSAKSAGERTATPAARSPFTTGSAKAFATTSLTISSSVNWSTATGDMVHNPPVAWYRTVVTSNQQLEDTAQLFLGQRIQCARCHHHPYEKWSPARLLRFRRILLAGRSQAEPGTAESGRTAGVSQAGRGPSHRSAHRHVASADRIGRRADRHFARRPIHGRRWSTGWSIRKIRSLPGRWSTAIGSTFSAAGLVDPEDDMRVTNPATNPELLDRLARAFVDSHFDLKQLIRTICQSQHLSAQRRAERTTTRPTSRTSPGTIPSDWPPKCCTTHSIRSPARSRSFPACRPGMRAVQLPDNGSESYFLSVFGKPRNQSACECERSGEATLAQALHLLNSPEVQAKLSDPAGRPAGLAAEETAATRDKIDEIYWTALSRAPSAEERELALAHLTRPEAKDNKRLAYEDIVWALLNTKEFLFNH